jgi:hypothetical protein
VIAKFIYFLFPSTPMALTVFSILPGKNTSRKKLYASIYDSVKQIPRIEDLNALVKYYWSFSTIYIIY